MNPIIILNAPPRVGKDTIARELVENHAFSTVSLKHPIYEIAAATLGMNLEDFMQMYEYPGWKDDKGLFDGRSIRDLMIHLSEKYVKPFFGKEYFGQRLATTIHNCELLTGEQCWVIPDGGFTEELRAIEDKFGDRVFVFQLQREGFRKFDGDSRSWISTRGTENTKMYDTTDGNNKVIQTILEL